MQTLECPAIIALDRKTTERLRQLAAGWQVTPEEVLNRAVERVDTSQSEQPDPKTDSIPQWPTLNSKEFATPVNAGATDDLPRYQPYCRTSGLGGT